MSDTLRPHGLQPTRLFCPWDFPSKSTEVGCHFLLQGIFPIQGSNPGLLHCSQILLLSEPPGKSTQWKLLFQNIFEKSLMLSIEITLLFRQTPALYPVSWVAQWSGKESACQRGRCNRPGSILGSGRSPGEGNGSPLQYSCLGNSKASGAWRATAHGVTELHSTEQTDTKQANSWENIYIHTQKSLHECH